MIDDYRTEEFRKLVRPGSVSPSIWPICRLPMRNDTWASTSRSSPGSTALGFPVYLGLMSGQQMRDIADVAEEAGGDIRLTRRQNFILAGIPAAKLDATIACVAEIGFPLDANGLYASSIGCIGDPHCNYAVTPTKEKLATIIERLVKDFGNQVADLKVNLDGCPHACAQHWTGDIGLQGTTGRGPNGEPLEAFDIILRGGLGRDAAIGKPLLRRIPSERVEDYVSRLFAGYLAHREAEETFTRFCVRTSDLDLVAIAEGTKSEGAQAVA